jgi:hypothetical protein
MNPIPFDALKATAAALKAAGTPWHFHMIGPKCRLDQSIAGFVLILEDEASGEVFTCRFSDRPVSQTHQMALLCYGPDFLKKEQTPALSPGTEKNLLNADFQKIMEQATRCRANGKPWHNHHLPPRCKFNPKPGNHCIVFENEAAGQALYAYYDNDPTGDLAELEKLFFTE